MKSKATREVFNQTYVEYDIVPSDACVSDEGSSNLRAFLGRQEEGQSKIWTAPFYRERGKDVPMETVLDEWDKELSSIASDWPTLYEFEKDLRNKVGPLSVQKALWERIPDCISYYTDIDLDSVPVSEEAVSRTLQEFSSISGLRLASKQKTLDRMKKSTSSGTPFMSKRRNVLEQTLQSRVSLEDEDKIVISDYSKYYRYSVKYETPAVLGWRGQEGGAEPEDTKQRVIWMFPFSVNLEELRCYHPLISGCQKHNLVPAWVSMDAVDQHITNMFDTKSSHDLVVCTDFSKFDQHFNSHLQAAAHDVLSRLLVDAPSSRDWLDYTFRIKYKIPLIVSKEESSAKGYNVVQFIGDHGMASGSGGTNADETLAHRCLQHEVALMNGQRLNQYSQCLGDDGILTYPGITVDQVIEAYESHGQVCNAEKQYASTQDCVYLRRWHHVDYRINGICAGVYSTFRAIGRLRYLERFMNPDIWSKEMVCLRQLSIIENCKYHPLRESFVKFCMKGDKYRLGLDIPGFLEGIDSYQKEAMSSMPDFLGYTKTLQGEDTTPASAWWVVKYLLSLR